MSPYIHFSESQKEQAASVDLEALLRSRGEKLITSGRDKRLASDHSVTIRGNRWYDHATCEGGHAISFVQRFYRMGYQEAVLYLLGDTQGVRFPCAEVSPEEPPKPFELPTPNRDMRRVFAYLVKQRKIDREVVARFAKAHLLFEDAKYHNAVFVGVDADGTPRHAHVRSTLSHGPAFRINIEGSDPKHCFHYSGQNGNLFVFEAPIDMLSYITLNQENWQENSYVSCCGTSSQPVLEMLKQMPQIQTVYLCMDNDTAGDIASERIAKQLQEQGYCAERILPTNKDWNDDLTALCAEEEVNNTCLSMQGVS